MREATAADVPHVLAMAQEFHAKSRQAAPFDPDAMSQFLGRLVDLPDAVVFVTKGGFIAGAVSPAYCCPSWLLAVELMWWATDGQGRALLQAFEGWAKAKGADEIRMTTLAAIEGPEKILTRKGYAASEVSYAKVI